MRNFYRRLKVAWKFLWGNRFPLKPEIGRIAIREDLQCNYVLHIPMKIDGCDGDYVYSMLFSEEYLDKALVKAYPELKYKNEMLLEPQNGASKPSKK